jgi:membrane protease YdiL (CAAX protease family)
MRYVLFVTLTLGLTAFISWTTYHTARLLRGWHPDRNLLLLPPENALRMALVLVCLGLGLLSGLPAETLGWKPATPLVDVLIGLLMGVLLSLALTYGSQRALARWGDTIYSPIVILSVLPRNRREWVLVLLALVPVALLEELLFRSLLLGGLSPLLPAWLLVAGLAALFGILHLPQGWLGVVGTAAAGILFSGLFLWRASLLAPLTAHYVADALQLLQASRSKTELSRLQAPSE